MLAEASRQWCWKQLRGDESHGSPREVFAVLDGARARKLPGFLVAEDVEFACLLQNVSEPVAMTRAPYVTRVPGDSNLWRWLVEEGWGQSWGIFALAQPGADLDTVVRDLRENLHARLPDGRVVFFRFFDPRVWRPFFPTCDTRQADSLFGRAIRAFGCEGEDGHSLLLDSFQDEEPHRQRLPLTDD
ncbi:MAG TPA: DUF4123 domain-containing protein [Chthoniobacter sp.]|jgi:hypothetical protein